MVISECLAANVLVNHASLPETQENQEEAKNASPKDQLPTMQLSVASK